MYQIWCFCTNLHIHSPNSLDYTHRRKTAGINARAGYSMRVVHDFASDCGNCREVIFKIENHQDLSMIYYVFKMFLVGLATVVRLCFTSDNMLLIDWLYCIDLFSCIAASVFNKLTYLLTYLLTLRWSGDHQHRTRVRYFDQVIKEFAMKRARAHKFGYTTV